VEITGSSDPLPTIIFGGQFNEGGEEDKLLDEDVMWASAPESMYHSPDDGGVSVMVLKELASAC
jgi:hypothetical protein